MLFPKEFLRAAYGMAGEHTGAVSHLWRIGPVIYLRRETTPMPTSEGKKTMRLKALERRP
jgi:hypothetical protein